MGMHYVGFCIKYICYGWSFQICLFWLAKLTSILPTITCLALQCICIIGSLAYLLLRLPSGAAAAPSKFCVASEALCDLANELMVDHVTQGEQKLHGTTICPLQNYWIPYYHTPQPIHWTSVVPPSPEHNGKCNVYIDDIITIGLCTPQLIVRLQRAIIVAINCLFHPLHPNEADYRNHVLSLWKLAGNGALCEPKVVLGWLINIRVFLISLPVDKFKTKHLVSWIL